MSDSLQPHESQHARPPCSSPTPGVYSNSWPSSQWCHPAISTSVVPFSCSQSLPASGSFPMSHLFAWDGQSTGVSASASVLPMNTWDWSLGWTGWISLQSKGLSRVFSNAQCLYRLSNTMVLICRVFKITSTLFSAIQVSLSDTIYSSAYTLNYMHWITFTKLESTLGHKAFIILKVRNNTYHFWIHLLAKPDINARLGWFLIQPLENINIKC